MCFSKIVTKLLVLLISLGPISLMAGRGDGHGGPGHHRDGQKIFRKLNLTEDQRSKMKELRSGNKGVRKELRQQIKATRQKMKTPNLTTDQMKSIHEELKGLENQMMDLRFQRMLQVKEILTAEQFEKFKSLRKDRRKDRKKRKEMREQAEE